MITAEKVQKLSNLSLKNLADALTNKGYTEFERPMQATFLGITNSGDFCYKFVYRCRDEGTWAYGKLFVNVDDNNRLIADY